MSEDLRQRYETVLIDHQHLDAHGCQCGWNTRPFTGASFAAHVTGELLAVRDEQQVALLRLLDERADVIDELRHRAEAAERRLVDMRRLVETALHLRQHGEYAPGGTENWRQWDRDAETALLAALDGESQ